MATCESDILTNEELDLLQSLTDWELETWLTSLPRPNQLKILKALSTHKTPLERATTSLAEFSQQAWRVVEPETPLDWGPHLDAMCEHLEAVGSGRILNLLITTPPGTTKSILAVVMFPAWLWINSPNDRLLVASNDQAIVLRDAVASRRILESEWYRGNWPSVRLTSDQNAKGWYENTSRGYRSSTTVNSAVTGKKGDILILDDPHDARKVYSAVERRDVKEWWKAFYNRVNHPKTSRRIVVGQRTHVDDLQGVLAKDGEFTHLNLMEEFVPALAKATSIGWSDWRTEHGELLRPDRFGEREIAQAKIQLGLAGYEAQHQQNPITVEGAEFPIEWFGDSIWFEEFPGDAQCRPLVLDPSKGKDAKAGDYSAFVWGLVDSTGVCWVDADLERYNLKLLAELSIERFKSFRSDVFGVETNQFQELLCSQVQDLASALGLMLPVYELENTVKKEVRIRRLAPFLGHGKIRFKANSRGTALLVEQLKQFPLGEHDDGPDALEMFVRTASLAINGRNQDDGLGDSLI